MSISHDWMIAQVQMEQAILNRLTPNRGYRMNWQDDQIEIQAIQELSQEFGVNFHINNTKMGPVYCFGPIEWHVASGSKFCLADYMAVLRRLAATFPEHVLGKKPE